MAKDIGNPGVSELLTQAFQLQGRVRMQLEESIVPVVSLGDLSIGSPPPITRHAVATWDQPAIAAERFVMRIEVPGNIIAVITRIAFVPIATAVQIAVLFGSSFPAPTTAALKSFTDGRLLDAGNQFPALVVVVGTQVANLAGQFSLQIADGASANSFEYLPRGWVLGTGRPGQFGFIEFASSVLNGRVRGSIEWDEYQIV